jgi:hypothetical protein
MQEPTRAPENHNGDGDPLGTPAPIKEHRQKPEDAHANSSESKNKFYQRIKAHWKQIKDLQAHDKLNLAFTGIIAIATTVYVIVAIGQLEQMKRQLPELKKSADAAKETADTTRNTLVTSQRPWVHPSAPIRLTKPIILEPNKIVVFGEILVKNYGPSPALSVVSSVDIVTDIKNYQQRADNGCNLIERISRENEFAKDKFGPPLFPQETIAQPFANSDDTLHPNLTILYFAGCIIYRDQFGATLHHTRFCFETPNLAKDFTTTDTLVNCNIGQEAD